MTNPKQKDLGEKSPKELSKELADALENLALAEKERDEYLAGWKRAKADFINHKKESATNLAGLADMLKMNFVYSILPVLDALEESKDAGVEGLGNIATLLLTILEREGIEEIKTKKGDNFSPEIHEAIEGKGESIEEIIQKGYKYNAPAGEKVIRATKVRVINN